MCHIPEYESILVVSMQSYFKMVKASSLRSVASVSLIALSKLPDIAGKTLVFVMLPNGSRSDIISGCM